MAINFDKLPKDKPNVVVDKGTYYATIDQAEMKSPKDPQKPQYLSLTLNLQNVEGKSMGKVFDILSASEHELVRYKLARFIDALKIPLTGMFELKDLAKVVVGKKLIVDITTEEKEGYAPRAVVDIFTNQIYYSIDNASDIFDSTLPNTINASDAADAQESPRTVEY